MTQLTPLSSIVASLEIQLRYLEEQRTAEGRSPTARHLAIAITDLETVLLRLRPLLPAPASGTE